MQMPPAKETAVLQTPVPTLTDADRVAAFPPVSPHPMHDHDFHAFTLFDRFETHGSAFEWEGSTWIGTDLDRLWIRSEGQRANGRVEDADLEVLYGRSVATWWDVVAGIRHDITPGAGQNFAAVGIIGVAPGKFEVKATAYAGSGGQTTLRLEAEREFLLTQRLVLQPLVEVNLFGRDDARRGIGSGLATLEAGLRLRYEITRRFAPYIGMVREEAFGRTADFRRGDGDDVHDTRLVAGLRFWF
ncbi:MAG TPA: copper resistance protein B [Xanthomonadaceae bacterium]